MGLLERIDHARQPAARASSRHDLTFQDYVNYFTYDGVQYPLVQTTSGSIDEEQVAQTTAGAYRTNGIVFALTVARLQVFSQARFQWTRFEGGVPTRLFGTRDLRILERPWRGGTTADLLARMEVDVTTAGNSYIRRLPGRLARLRPDWVIVVLGSNEDPDHPAEASDVEVAGYVYDPPNGRMVAFEPWEVAHYAPLPDPANNFLGISWVTPALRDTQADSAMTEHKRQFLMNAATPNMLVKFDPTVKYEQAKNFKKLMLEEYTGWRNAWKTMFLMGGADAQVVGQNFQQLDFAVTQGKGESRLAADAGVPPSWVGFSEGLQGSALNAGNFDSARRRFSDGTMMHLWTNASASLEVIVPPPDDAAALWFDLRGVAFLRENAADLAAIQEKEAAIIVSLVRDGGFTWRSAIDAVRNKDWSRLTHTGLISVQQQLPVGVPTVSEAAQAGQAGQPASAAVSSNGDTP